MRRVASGEPRRRRRPRRRALTLLESIIAVGVLAVSVLAVSYAIVAGQVVSQESDRILQCIHAAEQLMERILALPYHDPDGASSPGPESGEWVVEDFDNADDYHGYADTISGGAQGTYIFRTVNMTATSEPVGGLGESINGLSVTVAAENDAGATRTIVRFIPERDDGT